MGGFLQAVAFGYGGIRVGTESLLFEQPRLIANTSKLLFKNLNYLGTAFDYTIKSDTIELNVQSTGVEKLRVNAPGTTFDLVPGEDYHRPTVYR